jgi:hypothetical protein
MLFLDAFSLWTSLNCYVGVLLLLLLLLFIIPLLMWRLYTCVVCTDPRREVRARARIRNHDFLEWVIVVSSCCSTPSSIEVGPRTSQPTPSTRNRRFKSPESSPGCIISVDASAAATTFSGWRATKLITSGNGNAYDFGEREIEIIFAWFGCF